MSAAPRVRHGGCGATGVCVQGGGLGWSPSGVPAGSGAAPQCQWGAGRSPAKKILSKFLNIQFNLDILNCRDNIRNFLLVLVIYHPEHVASLPICYEVRTYLCFILDCSKHPSQTRAYSTTDQKIPPRLFARVGGGIMRPRPFGPSLPSPCSISMRDAALLPDAVQMSAT